MKRYVVSYAVTFTFDIVVEGRERAAAIREAAQRQARMSREEILAECGELDFDEARTEMDRTCVDGDGVRWTSYLRHSDVKLFSAVVPWGWIERVSRGELP